MPDVFGVSVVMGRKDAAWQASWRAEAARQLRAVADAVESGALSHGPAMVIRDADGTDIGEASVLDLDD